MLCNFSFPSTKDDRFSVSIQPPVGELLLPVTMSEKDFKKEQGEKDFSSFNKCICMRRGLHAFQFTSVQQVLPV